MKSCIVCEREFTLELGGVNQSAIDSRVCTDCVEPPRFSGEALFDDETGDFVQDERSDWMGREGRVRGWYL